MGCVSTLLAFDTAYVYFRSFFGVPDRFHADDGTPVNAVRGTLDAVSRLVEQYQPTHLACAWDNDWRPQWRTDLVPSYKAHRVATESADGPDEEQVPPELTAQIPLIIEALATLGITPTGIDDYEADDVLGSLATQFEGRTLVVTGDRDLFQLVDDARRVRGGVEATRAGLPREGLPVVLVHGVDDGLIPIAFTSDPYVAWARTAGREVSLWRVHGAQHFDGFLVLPDYAERYVPLIPYVHAALDQVVAHLDGKGALPADADIVPAAREGAAVPTAEGLNIP